MFLINRGIIYSLLATAVIVKMETEAVEKNYKKLNTYNIKDRGMRLIYGPFAEYELSEQGCLSRRRVMNNGKTIATP